MLDNGNDENEDTYGNENKNASENEDRNEDGTTEAGTKTGDIIEKNKATMYPFAIFADVGNALIPSEKLPENSTLAKVTMRGGIMIGIFIRK